jgi:hypothetical protein
MKKKADTMSKYVVQHPDIAWREVDGRAAIITPSDGTLRMLNETGTFLWKRMERASKVASLLAALEKTYDVGAGQACRDVLSFINRLERDGMLVSAERKSDLPG